jgi:Pyruvate/2-oxoacid:ferredoxin oxidoreductase delta subunit
MLDLCASKSVPLVNFEAGGWMTQSVGERAYQISRVVKEADYIVNLAKFKTHVLTLLTGAIKNMFGCVPGFRKSALHLAHPRPARMSMALVDIFSLVPPLVSLADSVVSMDGNGPSSGRRRELGFVAASTDAVALDTVLARVAGIDPMRVPTTSEAYRRGLGEARLDHMNFPCLRPEEVAPGDFKVPGNWKFALIPGFAGRVLSQLVWVRPVIDTEACTGCLDCYNVCAARAIDMRRNKAAINHRLCTSCLCCHEACPVGAVEVGMSRLARLLA